MVDSPRRTVLLALAVLCVTTPVWASALDITGREYQYRAALVTVEDERVRVVGDHPRFTGFDSIDCFHERVPSRRCGFESRLIDGSSIRAPYPNVRHVSGNPSLDAREQYVAFAGHGQVFERTTQWNDSAGAYVLGLVRVDGREVLAEKPLTERVFELLSIGVGVALFDRGRRDSGSSLSQ
jgi:hypothetical protein